jgi:hypothetical protein
MKLADLLVRYQEELECKYGAQLLPEQRRAIEAILKCRTSACGESLAVCPDCNRYHWHAHSCSHRSCPQCQNQTATQWLDRQRRKLLPVRYYLLTFTLPCQLRQTAYRNQKNVYDALFKASAETIREVASNPKYLGAEPGMTGVLHTHSRRLEIHPHTHFVITGGGIDSKQNLWVPGRRKYLFPSAILKKLFREKFLAELRNAGINYSKYLHNIDWVVNIKAAGRGEPALQYLSKYLYKGVIQERNIISDLDGQISFEYEENKTGRRLTRTLPAADFLFLILKHVLPKGFRRSRDYGFHHGNAKRKLQQLQLILKCEPPATNAAAHRPLPCPKCGTAMIIVPTSKERQVLRILQNRGSPAEVLIT